MRMTLGLAAAVVAIAATTVAHAQEEVIKARKAIMQVNQQAAAIAFKMAEGEIPYDPAIAAAALSAISHDNEIFPTFFPDGSDTGDTKANPAIWQDKAAFVALSVKMVADAKIAAEAASTLEGLQAKIEAVGQNCAACHKQFRLQSP